MKERAKNKISYFVEFLYALHELTMGYFTFKVKCTKTPLGILRCSKTPLTFFFFFCT